MSDFEKINDEFKQILLFCSKTAFKHGFKIYLVGGIVRDLILNLPIFDIDVMVEGDAIEFCKLLEKEGNERKAVSQAEITQIQNDLKTVKMFINQQEVDFASTRKEIYPQKGRMPVVTEIGCSLKEDVIRRDFTINALAMSLNEENFGVVIDYVDGRKDINDKTLRVLHDVSFIDDPTRIVRGLKFAVRLGFKLDEHTAKLQENYLENVNYDMCFERLKSELKQSFNLNQGVVFDEFIRQSIYKLVSPKIELQPIKGKKIENVISRYLKGSSYIYLIYLSCVFDISDLNIFNFSNKEKNILKNAQNLVSSVKNGYVPENYYQVYKFFEKAEIEAVIIFHIKMEDAVKTATLVTYLEELRDIKLEITGDDLINLGFTPGSRFVQILDETLKEKLLNGFASKSDELNFVQNYIYHNSYPRKE